MSEPATNDTVKKVGERVVAILVENITKTLLPIHQELVKQDKERKEQFFKTIFWAIFWAIIAAHSAIGFVVFLLMLISAGRH